MLSKRALKTKTKPSGSRNPVIGQPCPPREVDKHITPLKVGIEHCEHLLKVYDPSDTLAPPILKESEDGIFEGVQGEVDTALKVRCHRGQPRT